MNELKACPFCGKTKINLREYGSGWKAQCSGVICLASRYYSPTKDEAIAAWNTRSSAAEAELGRIFLLIQTCGSIEELREKVFRTGTAQTQPGDGA